MYTLEQSEWEQSDELETVASPGELTELKKLPDVFAPLIAKIQEQHKWTYQEGFVALLAKDLASKRYD